MKKKMIILLASMVMTLAACGNAETANESEPESMEASMESESESEEIIESEESSEMESSEEESVDFSAYIMEPDEYSYKVNITINPQLALYVSENEEGEEVVLAWTFDNEDAEEAYKNTDFHDMPVLDAVKEAVLVAAEKEYLKEDGTVEINIVTDTEEIPEDTIKSFVEAANAVIKEKELNSTVKITENGKEIKTEEQEKEVAESKENNRTSTKETSAPSEDKKTASNKELETPTLTVTPTVTPTPTETPAPQEEKPAQPAENNGDYVDAKGIVCHPDGSTGSGICSSKDSDGVDRNRCANPTSGEVYYDSITYYDVVNENGEFKNVITYAHPTGGHVRCTNCGGSRDYLCYDWEESRKDYVWEEGTDMEAYLAARHAAIEEYQDPEDESLIDPNTTYEERALQYANSKVKIEDYTIEGHWVQVN